MRKTSFLEAGESLWNFVLFAMQSGYVCYQCNSSNYMFSISNILVVYISINIQTDANVLLKISFK